MKKSGAFTLAEVLITLGVIGVVSAITLPLLVSSYQKFVLKNQFKKSYSIISNALRNIEADLGYTPQCYYWDKSPYGPNHCVEYNEKGECAKYEMSDGSPLPPDLNGAFQECPTCRTELKNNLKVIKVCKGNAKKEKCIPDYKGTDVVKKAENDSLTDYEINVALSGCGAWKQDSIDKKNWVYVLADGQILMTYGSDLPFSIFMIDVNGKKGPNKWGHDMFGVQVVANKGTPLKLSGNGCMVVEKGGVYTTTMIRNMNQ